MIKTQVIASDFFFKQERAYQFNPSVFVFALKTLVFSYLHKKEDTRATGQSLHLLAGERLWPTDIDLFKGTGWNLATMTRTVFLAVS